MYVNFLGETIECGAPVITFTTCTGYEEIREAVYIGYIPATMFYSCKLQKMILRRFVQVRRPDPVFQTVVKETGEKYDYYGNMAHRLLRKLDVESRCIDDTRTRVTTLQHNRVLLLTPANRKFAEDVMKIFKMNRYNEI